MPSEEAVQIALRTQQLIAYETGVTDTVDPLAGSYYLESLTREICQKAEEYIEKIDEMGGAVSAIERGYIQKEIQDSAYKYQRDIEEEERIVVGLNRFKIQELRPGNLLRVDPAVRMEQIEKILNLKKNRNESKVKETLSSLKKAAEGKENLMPPILEAVKAYATLGEICDVMRGIFGEYQATSTVGN